MAEVILGIGSNEREREKNILKAVELLDEDEKVTVQKLSPFYETKPIGPSTEPFLNGATLITTSRKPAELLGVIKNIEKLCGRKPSKKWGEKRPVDFDILLYNDIVIDMEKLKIPHRALTERDFALQPLIDLNPELVHPSLKIPMVELLKNIRCKTIISGPIKLPSKINYEILEHTADIGFETSAENFKKLIETSAMSLADMMVKREKLSESIRVETSVEGFDLQELIIGLLQEIIYYFEIKKFLPLRVVVKPGSRAEPAKGGKITVVMFGSKIIEEDVELIVKAATYHMIDIRREKNQYKARIYLDI